MNKRRFESYTKLKYLYHAFRATLNPHLDASALVNMGVDVCNADLWEETTREGLYYLPMSQSRLQSVEDRPESDIGFCMDDHQWDGRDAWHLLH